MSITPQQRLDKRNELIDRIANIYSSAEAGEFYQSVFNKFHLDVNHYIDYINLIGDTILGFYKTTDLPRLFQSELGMSADEAQRLMSELIEFLSPVIEREQSATKIKKEDIQKLAQTFEEANQKRPKEVSPEGKPEGVAPLRTMEGDMNRIHGYGAAARAQSATDEPVVKAVPQADLTSAPVAPVSTAPAPAVPPPPAPPSPPRQPDQQAVQSIPIKKVE